LRIISFAWTTRALLEGRKTVTRRNWKECRLKPGELEKEGGLWETPEDYIRDWQEAYPGSHKWSLVWRIGFEVVPKHCEGL